jgi:hypothetical protein
VLMARARHPTHYTVRMGMTQPTHHHHLARAQHHII